MRFALRHPLPVLIVVAALALTTGVFVFAAPEYHPRYESKMIDFSKQEYFSPDRAQRAFAAHGIKLHATEGQVGITIFNRRGAVQADALQVVVAPRTGTGSWGPKLEPYDVRFGNVLVTYGEDDNELLDRVKAAVEDLR